MRKAIETVLIDAKMKLREMPLVEGVNAFEQEVTKQ